MPVPGRPRPLGYGSGLAPGVTPANSNTRISAAALPRQPQAPVPSSGGNLGLNSDRLRQAMVQRLRAQGISDERVLNAMAAVLPPSVRGRGPGEPRLRGIGAAYRPFTDHFPALGGGAHDLGGLRGPRPDRVLEVGAGCGYQAAVLAQIVREVHSIERIRGLYELARITCARCA